MSKRGVSIPTAMFFVMISFMISTVMAARVHMDLQISRYDGLDLERELAARGGSAQALIELNKDDNWKEHNSSNRVLFESMSTARFNVEGWVEQDAQNPIIYHVFGRAFVDGTSGQDSISSRVTLRRPDVEGLTFTNVSVPGQFQPDSMFYKRGYDADWTLLPPCPRWTYSDNMVLQEHGGYPGAVNNLASDERGRVYAHYTSGYDDSGIVGDIYREKYSNFINSGDFHEMYRAMPDYVESLGFGLRKIAFGNSVLMRFDTTGSEWEALPAVPDVSYSNGTAQINPSKIYDGGVGPIEVTNTTLYTTLYRDGHDAMLKLDLATNQWDVIQPPGGMPEATQAEADEKGNIYAKWADQARESAAIFRKSGNSGWVKIPDPPKGQFDDKGKWTPMPGLVEGLGHMDVTPDGRVYGVWDAHQSNPSFEYVVYEFSKASDGTESWTPIPPAPSFSYKDGKLVQHDGSAKQLKSLALDSENRIISSINDDRQGDSLVYQQGNEYIPYAQLPNKTYTKSGQLVDKPEGRALEAFQAEGGGYVNGQEDRYITVYRY